MNWNELKDMIEQQSTLLAIVASLVALQIEMLLLFIMLLRTKH